MSMFRRPSFNHLFQAQKLLFLITESAQWLIQSIVCSVLMVTQRLEFQSSITYKSFPQLLKPIATVATFLLSLMFDHIIQQFTKLICSRQAANRIQWSVSKAICLSGVYCHFIAVILSVILCLLAYATFIYSLTRPIFLNFYFYNI